MLQTIVLDTEPKRTRVMGAFRLFLFWEKKGMLDITYFVDHKNKKIHSQRYAGDKCGFLDTPVKEREFTDSEEYIIKLESEKGFYFCSHCKGASLSL